MNAALALWAGGTADSSTALIVQSPRSSTSWACDAFEVVERPEDRQPAVLGRRGQAGQVGRVHDQHGVELEADRGRGWTFRTPASSSAASTSR